MGLYQTAKQYPANPKVEMACHTYLETPPPKKEKLNPKEVFEGKIKIPKIKAVPKKKIVPLK